jgi:translocator protein
MNDSLTAASVSVDEPLLVRSNSALKNTMGLIAWVLVCFGASAVGAIFTTAKIPEWYATLIKPDWTPPSWLFGPVWTLLYAMMAVAAWMVWKRSGFAGAKAALGMFLFQLALNSMWSWLFFGRERPDWAAIEIVILWFAIVATIVLFRRHSGIAAGLMVPYILWVTFATALNIAIWRLNS